MKSANGFTLLELLIGMTLLGFMLALLFGGFRLASSSWDAVERRVQRTTDEEMGRALVRRMLSQLQPMRWKRGIGQPLTFVGERKFLRAIAPVASHSNASGLRAFELGQMDTSGKDSSRLVLRHAALRYDQEHFFDNLADAKQYLVLGDLASVEFSYFGPERRGQPPHWQEVWTNPDQLPRLIKVHLASADAGWSDVVVAPMIGGTGCRWDNFHKRCR